MADHIHNILSEFRDTMLSAVARLEFQIRDTVGVKTGARSEQQGMDFENTVRALMRRIDALENQQREESRQQTKEVATDEILTMSANANTRNVIVSNVKSTPALSAAIAAANPPALELSTIQTVEGNWLKEPEPEEAEPEEEEEEEAEEEEEEGSVQDEQLKKVVIQGVSYYMDGDLNVYHETEEGYEQVGVYNLQSDCVDLVEEEEEAEEAEVEVEEFKYKGKIYQRDDEGNVYEDGEVIGTWNGKSIDRIAA